MFYTKSEKNWPNSFEEKVKNVQLLRTIEHLLITMDKIKKIAK